MGRTDKTLNGKMIYSCDDCGVEAVAGSADFLSEWVKMGITGSRECWYYCSKCKNKYVKEG